MIESTKIMYIFYLVKDTPANKQDMEKSAEIYAFPSWHLNYLKITQNWDEHYYVIDSPKT